MAVNITDCSQSRFLDCDSRRVGRYNRAMSRKVQFNLWQLVWFMAAVCLAGGMTQWNQLPTAFGVVLIASVAIIGFVGLFKGKRRVVRLIRILKGRPDRGIVIRSGRDKRQGRASLRSDSRRPQSHS
jgi:hypothetical protein